MNVADRSRYLLVTYHDSFQVYSTADSLLVRRISLPLRAKGRLHNQHAYIAAVSASKASVDLVWVGCSDGRIWRLDWTAGSIEELKTRNGSQLTSMAVETITVAGVPQEVLFTSERVGDGSEVLAYLPTNLAEPDVRSVYTHTSQIQRFQAASGGRTLVATSGKTIIIGERKRAGVGAFEDIKYRFVCFDISDEISALDVRSSPRKPLKTQDPGQESSSLPLIDLAIGCVHGSILIYGDILGGVRGIEAKGSQIPPIQPRKNHWHRKAVHCVKWSRDGTIRSRSLFNGRLTAQRQLFPVRRFGDRPRLVADRHGQAGLSPASRGKRREHCRLPPGFLLRGPPRRQLNNGPFHRGNEAHLLRLGAAVVYFWGPTPERR